MDTWGICPLLSTFGDTIESMLLQDTEVTGELARLPVIGGFRYEIDKKPLRYLITRNSQVRVPDIRQKQEATAGTAGIIECEIVDGVMKPK